MVLFFVFIWIPSQYIEDQSNDDQEGDGEEFGNMSNSAIKEADEDEEGYRTSSENEDDGYQCEMSSKFDSSFTLSNKK